MASSKIVVVLCDSDNGEAVRIESTPGSGSVRILSKDKKAEPIDLWIDQLKTAIEEVEEFEEDET
jgi:hypothetical protein